MKLSNKILLSVFGLVVVSVISLLVAVRLDLGEVEAATITEPAVREISVSQFEVIALEKRMDVSLLSGSEYKIKILGSSKEDVNAVINARVNQGVLDLDLPGSQEGGNRRFKIQITTPMVKKIILNNNAKISIENLSQDSLELDLSEAANLFARKITLDHLLVEATGKTRIRSEQSVIQHVSVKLHERSECILFNLDGASIAGELRQHAQLLVSGWTRKLAVDMDEEARVIKRD